MQSRMAWPMSQNMDFDDEVIKLAEKVVRNTWEFNNRRGLISENLEKIKAKRRSNERRILLAKNGRTQRMAEGQTETR